MKRRELEEMRALEDRHPWFDARRRALAPMVTEALAQAPPGAWLDLGAGTGANVEAWSGTRPCIALDRASEALSFLRARSACADVRGVQASAERLPFADASCACVTAFDLLEHVDDAATLGEIARVLKPGGRLVVSVPTWPSLWSEHDVALGHRRRYRPRALRALLVEHGFRVRTSGGFLFSALPFVWLMRTVRRTRPSSTSDPRTDFASLGPFATRVLALCLRLDRVLARCIRPKVGLSLLVSGELRQGLRRADKIARTSSSGSSSAGASPSFASASQTERPAATVAR